MRSSTCTGATRMRRYTVAFEMCKKSPSKPLSSSPLVKTSRLAYRKQTDSSLCSCFVVRIIASRPERRAPRTTDKKRARFIENGTEEYHKRPSDRQPTAAACTLRSTSRAACWLT